MRFVWDEDKNCRNRKKHGLSFETACLVFDDPRQLNIQDRFEYGEERWQTLGRIGEVLVVLVAHTWYETADELVVRIISARKATRLERVKYEQAH